MDGCVESVNSILEAAKSFRRFGNLNPLFCKIFGVYKSGPVHTYPSIFENASFYPFWIKVHTETAFSVTRSFSKTLSRVDLFENAVLLFSFGRVKTELFENADVTASIYTPSEHAVGSLGITQGHFVYVFSNFEYLSVFVWTGDNFENALCVNANIFYR